VTASQGFEPGQALYISGIEYYVILSRACYAPAQIRINWSRRCGVSAPTEAWALTNKKLCREVGVLDFQRDVETRP
jgi:hypothetical protein